MNTLPGFSKAELFEGDFMDKQIEQKRILLQGDTGKEEWLGRPSFGLKIRLWAIRIELVD